MTEQNYPGVSARVRAAVTDSLVIVVLLVIITYIFSYFENVPDAARIIAFILIFLLYDPIFTSFFGGTIGHMIIGIRVKQESNQEKNIGFPFATFIAVIIFPFLPAYLGFLKSKIG